ncbi:MAG: crotonase/enoyl-CoA hydratase family protein [Limnobacter sp.]|nr:crotonase/enoyl-CoA hydratase family protein [Limnobacter sp.]
MAKFLKFDRVGDVVILAMDEPDIRNPLTGNSAPEDFLEAFERVNNDRTIKVVVLTGNGPAFSCGGNVKDMAKYLGDEIAPATIRQDYQRGIQRISLGMYNLSVPTIAAVNGPAIGAGLDLACFCDIRIASEKAKFSEAFVNLSIIPGDGGAWILPRVVGMSKAAEMAFSGELIDAAEALRCGLVSQVVPHDELMKVAMDKAQNIASKGAEVLRMVKSLLRDGQEGSSLQSHLEKAAGYQAIAHKTAEHRAAVEGFMTRTKK